MRVNGDALNQLNESQEVSVDMLAAFSIADNSVLPTDETNCQVLKTDHFR